MALANKYDVVKYIATQHIEKYNTLISPLKLQKTLFYIYAYWSGNIARLRAMVENNDSNPEHDIFKDIDIDIFEPNFEAWTYGPVDPDVYWKYKSNPEQFVQDSLNALEVNPKKMVNQVTVFLDSITAQTFGINDFSLVDMTHETDSWKNAYKSDNKIISKEAIIDEFARRTA